MCGRFAIDDQVNAQLEAWAEQGRDIDEWTPADWNSAIDRRPRYSVAPSTVAPILREWADADGGHQTLSDARWGLRPSWARDSGPRPINARLETVASNGMFRTAFSTTRCVVPMSGYFEWTEAADGKDPWYIHGAGLLLAAGVYASRQTDDGWERSFTIITREAKDASGRVHDRMPVFLPASDIDTWLTPGKLTAPAEMLDILDQASLTIARTLSLHRVDRAVNRTRDLDTTNPDLIAPV